MLKTRIIVRLDIRNSSLIKPIQMEGVRVVGDPQEYATKYSEQGIDELLFMDAVASLYDRNSLEMLITHVSTNVFTPMTVGGGIRNVGDAGRMLRAGADKIAINTAAIKRPGLITEMAEKFGSQCMVLQIDAKKTESSWEAYIDGGREHSGKDVIEWANEGVELGAGEILLTSIDHEGTRKGFDLDLISAVKVSVPIIASGGAGTARHISDAIHAGANAVAIADILHFDRMTLPEIRSELQIEGINVR